MLLWEASYSELGDREKRKGKGLFEGFVRAVGWHSRIMTGRALRSRCALGFTYLRRTPPAAGLTDKYEGPGQKPCPFSGQKPITPCKSALKVMSRIEGSTVLCRTPPAAALAGKYPPNLTACPWCPIILDASDCTTIDFEAIPSVGSYCLR
jgi:hypothetical protein